MLENDIYLEKATATFEAMVHSVQRCWKMFKMFGEDGLLARKGARCSQRVTVRRKKNWLARAMKDATPADWNLGGKL